jgi:hypothetical protein
MPRRTISVSLRPAIFSPSNRICPESGLSLPEIKLNKVVLPAPFGPMIADRLPAAKWSET